MKRLVEFFQNLLRGFLSIARDPESSAKTQRCSGCQKRKCVYEEKFDSIGRDLAMIRKQKQEEEAARK